MKKLLLTLMLGNIILSNSFAQQTLVSGTVQGDEGETLPGVNITIKGTTQGTVTNVDGYFELEVNDPQNDVLNFSFIGFELQEVPVNGRTRIDVQLVTSTTYLEEVVAVGYGTMRRRDLTGAISSVDAETLELTPTFSVATALQGKVAGVNITLSEGSPDAEIKIRVRGGGSITQSNDPLYVIDGFTSTDGINNLDPTDIESIEVLKDASSAAIYGTRGANGVILITTKRGESGKMTVNYDTYHTWKKVMNYYDVMDPYNFVVKEYEIARTTAEMERFVGIYGEFDDIESNYLNRPGVDWQKETFGSTVYSQFHKLSVTGGDDNTKIGLSASYNDDNGVVINSGFKRSNFLLNLEQEINKYLTVTINTSYTDQHTYGMGTSGGGNRYNKFGHILMYRPTIGIEGEDSDLITIEDPLTEDDLGNIKLNPIIASENELITKRRQTLVINSGLLFNLTDKLKLNVTGGIRNQFRRNEEIYLTKSYEAKSGSGRPSVELAVSEPSSKQVNGTLQYAALSNSNHTLDIMVGSEYIIETNKLFETSVGNFPDDFITIENLGLGVVNSVGSYEEDEKLASYFSRVFYSLNDKYLVTATMRADGSSKFAPGNRWGYFPSGSVAWRISQESFMSNIETISNLKIRLSYGELGNNRIDNYAYMANLESVPYSFDKQVVVGTAPLVDFIPNSALKWETTKSSNLGIDLGLFGNRIQFTTELYNARTEDLLLYATVPIITGFERVFKNVGSTQNRGMEFTLVTQNIHKNDFRWTSNLNLSFNKSKVLALNDGIESFFIESGWGGNLNDYIIKVGEPVGSMYGYVSDGIYTVDDFDYNASTDKYTLKEGVPFEPFALSRTAPGVEKYADLNGDGEITVEDQKIIGDANPLFFGGFMNTFSYKNFDLTIFMNFSYGNDVQNANEMFFGAPDRITYTNNGLALLQDRWLTFDPADGVRYNDPENLARINADAKYPKTYRGLLTNYQRPADRFIEDASYIKINTISLGYTIPQHLLKKILIQRLRVYATANNIYTFTNYTGLDPEVSTRDSESGQEGLSPGTDWGSYPRPFSFILGLHISF